MLRRVHILQVLLFAFSLISSQGSRQDETASTNQRRYRSDNDGCEVGAKRPNIVLIITDDQDLHMNSLDYMPNVQKHLINEGTSYRRHFCTTALCCPSRVTLFTGKLAHNTNVTDVSSPYGGFPKFVSQGLNDRYLPIWLQDAGYGTYYVGKLFNHHSVGNYDSPYPAGWNSSDFILDPFMYWYLNSTWQRNTDPPASFEGEHNGDVLTRKALGMLDEAAEADAPFFLGIAPIAPHCNIWAPTYKDGEGSPITEVEFSPPVPAERHAELFKHAKVPRTGNFNPDKPSGASWIRELPKQSQEDVDFNDYYYRQRLRTLQTVDEMVDDIVKSLERHGILDNTYILYTTDNGYHIGQHRMHPAKQCSFEEDVNIPFIVRGPHVPRRHTTDIVTTHTDIAPTILDIASAPLKGDFDGLKIPLTGHDLHQARKTRYEHVTIEHWGYASNEGKLYDWYPILHYNNTYKAIRIVSDSYNLLYQVWCNNEHELYDLNTDPGEMNNLLHPDEERPEMLVGVPLEKVVSRLDSLLFVLKSCKGETCIRPWREIHPAGNVDTLRDALSPRFDQFYEQRRTKVRFDRCELGYILDAEGPQANHSWAMSTLTPHWHMWT